MNGDFNCFGKNQTIVEINLNTYPSEENHTRKEKDSTQRKQKINTNALVLIRLLLVAIIFTLFLVCYWINPKAVKEFIDVIKNTTLCFF